MVHKVFEHDWCGGSVGSSDIGIRAMERAFESDKVDRSREVAFGLAKSYPQSCSIDII